MTYGVWAFGLVASTIATPSLSTDLDRDSKVQDKIYDYAERAVMALEAGNYSEAEACSRLILLSDDIKVSVDFGTLSDDERTLHEAAIKQAMSSWEEALGQEIRFTFVPAEQSDVRISFKPTVRHFGRDVAGFATWSRNVYSWGNDRFTYRVASDVTLRTKTVDGQQPSYEALVHTAGHEIGHVLGMWDSPRRGDLMGPQDVNRPVLEPTLRERQALMDVRNRAKSVWQASHLARMR